MRRVISAAWLALAVGMMAIADKPQDDTGFAPLMDGNSFQGWEGNLQIFRIQDRAVVGGSLENPVRDNEYLCTKKQYANFELRLKFRVLGSNTNAGIQFRSQRVPESNEMVGYQADIGQIYWGCLYDERRHKLLAGPAKDDQAKIFKKDNWHDYVIRCEGRRIDLWLNGHHTVSYTEADHTIPQIGVIGLQIHRGTPAEAWYKDIRIEELGEKTFTH